jgi:hypothetical protein
MTFLKVTLVLALVGVWVLLEACRDDGPRRPMGPP